MSKIAKPWVSKEEFEAFVGGGGTPSLHTHVKVDITDTPWAWADVSKTGSNLTDLATRQHAGLTNITSDQHHAQVHAIVGAAHTAAGLTIGHVIRASAADAFAWAQLQHGDLGGVTSDQHHAQSHGTEHYLGGDDQVHHDSLAGFVAAEHVSLPNTIANVLTDHTKAAHDALGLDHGALNGRADDDHSIYAKLGGRAMGQVLTGGVDAGEDLTFQTTVHATKGSYIFSDMAVAGFLKNTVGGVVTGGNSILAGDLPSHTHDDRYYTETELDTGQLDTRYYTKTNLQTTGQAQVHWLNLTNKPTTFAPSDHASEHEVGGGDLVDHDSLTGFEASEHKSLPTTIGQVLTDHTKAVHDALGLSHDSLSDISINDHHPKVHGSEHYSGGDDQVNHDSLVGFVAAEHLSLPNSMANVINSGHTQAIHTALGLALQTRKLDDFGTPDDNTDLNATTTRHGLLIKLGGGTTGFLREDGVWAAPTPGAHAASHHVGGGDLVNHDSLTGFVAAEHKSLPNTIGQVLSDHTKAVHDALGLAHGSLSGVTSDQHHAQVHGSEHYLDGSDQVNHDSLVGFVAAEHVSLPNTIANVLTDHNVAAHNALSIDHGSLSGRADDDHSIYAKCGGRAMGQVLTGGLDAGEDLTFQTTAHATKGSYIFAEMTTAGFLKNTAGGVVTGGNSILAGDLPSHTHVKADITDTPWAWGDVSKAGSNLTDLATRQHAGLTDITSDQHHPQLHASAHLVGGGDALSVGVPVNIGTSNAAGTATNFARRDHVHAHPSALGTDLHHAQSHTLASHSTKAHSELSDAPADAHHDELHASTHEPSAADQIDLVFNSQKWNGQTIFLTSVQGGDILRYDSGDLRWENQSFAHASTHHSGGGDPLAFASIAGFGDYLDQAVKQASSPTFVTARLSALANNFSNRRMIVSDTSGNLSYRDLDNPVSFLDAPSGQYVIYTPTFNNLFYSADKRFTVTQTGLTDFNAYRLFNGDYDDWGQNNITTDDTEAVININLINKGEFGANGLTYSYGWIYIHFYFIAHTDDVKARLKTKNAGGEFVWRDYVVGTNISSKGSARVMKIPLVGNYYCSDVEIVIKSGTLGDPPYDCVCIAEIEFVVNRSARPYAQPSVNKSLSNSLFGTTEWRDSSNVVKAQVTPAGYGTFERAYLGDYYLDSSGLVGNNLVFNSSKWNGQTIYLTSVENGQILKYNSSTFRWENYDFVPSAHASSHLVGGSDALSVGVPVNIGTSNAAGTATNFVRRDHVHAHPSALGTDLHHPQSHTLASHSTKAHSELTGVTSDQHHAQGHGSEHYSGGDDQVNHDSLVGFVAAEHVSLPNTIANVLTDHTKAAHDALGLDHGALSGKSDDDHSQYARLGGRAMGQVLTGGVAASEDITFQTTAHATKGSYIFAEMTTAGFLKNTVAGVVTGGNPILAGDLPSHDHAHGDLTGVTSDQHHAKAHILPSTEHAQTGLTVGYVIRVLTTTTFTWAQLQHGDLGGVTSDQHHTQNHETRHRSGGADPLNHDNLAGFVTAEHLSLPNTIGQVLSDHTKAVHDALGLSHDSLVDVSVDDHHAKVHGSEHYSGGDDQVNHDSLVGFVAAEHVSLPNTIANVLSDHTKSAHDSLALDHGALSGRADDDHSIYAKLGGRAMGQVLTGGLDAGEDLTFQTTAHATKGSYIFAEMTTAGFLKNTVAGVVTGGNPIDDHASEHEVGGGDLVDHDSLTGFEASEHKSLPTTIGQVLSDHTKAVHDALGLSHDSLGDISINDHHPKGHGAEHYLGGSDQVNHDSLFGFVAAEHVSLPNTIANVLSNHTQAVHNALNIDADTLDTLHASSFALTTRPLDTFGVTTDITYLNATTAKHGLLMKLGGGTTNYLRADGAWAAPTPGAHAASHHVGGGDLVNHDSLTGFVAAEHKSLPNTIGQVLSDHTKAVHDALGIDAATVGTLAASAFIRANADDNVSGHTEWQDGYQVRLGNSADFRMWHDGSHHYFRSYLHGSNLYIQLENAGGTNQTLLTFDPDVLGVMVRDHGAYATDMVVNVCYGTGAPPAASTTTLGAIFLKYTA